LGRVLKTVVEENLLQYLGKSTKMRIAGAANLVEESFGAEGLEVSADLVELLAGIAHDLAGFGDVVEVGSELQEGKLPTCRLLRYSSDGGHSILLW